MLETLINPARSKIGRDPSVESLLIKVLPLANAERARAAVKTR